MPQNTTLVDLPAVLNLQGELLLPAHAKVPVFDRSYLYGDSLYEVIRSYDGRFLPSQMKAHMDRLWQSARLCRMKIDQTPEELIGACEQTLDFFKRQPFATKDVYCRIILSRGVGKIGFGLSALLTPTQYTILVQPVDTPSEEAHERGLHLRVVERYRNHPKALDPAMKSGNYLNNLLSYLEGTAKGDDDALICDHEGFVTEGTTFNIFYVKRGIVCTPPLPVGILDGITRRVVIAQARGLGLEVRESFFPKERLHEADEVFATSTLKEVMAVTRVDGKKIGKGGAGPVTRRLREAFGGAIRRELS